MIGGQRFRSPVWYNDWRQVKVPALEAFEPEFPVSVVVPYYMDWDELGRTLAALERQTYPRDLFEVVVVDDGSPEPLTRSLPTPLDVKVAGWCQRLPDALVYGFLRFRHGQYHMWDVNDSLS